jgi:hypothetical protein
MTRESDHVVVLVPGIMGSVLQRNGKTVWPGPVQSLLLPYRPLDELLDPSLEATDVIRSYWFSTQYGALIHDLGNGSLVRRPGGLQRGRGRGGPSLPRRRAVPHLPAPPGERRGHGSVRLARVRHADPKRLRSLVPVRGPG